MTTGLKTPKHTRNGKKNEDLREKEKKSVIFSFFCSESLGTLLSVAVVFLG